MPYACVPCARLPSVCAGLWLLLCDATVWCAAVLGVCSPTVVTRQRQAAVFSGSASARAGRQRRCVAPWGRGTYLWWHLSHGAQGASDCVAAVQAIRVDGGPAGAGRVGNKETIPTHTQPRPRIAAVVQASRGGPASALGLVLCALRTGGADADEVRLRLQSGSLQANGRAT